MSKLTIAITLITLGIFSPSAADAAKHDTIKSFMDAETMIVGWVDLTELNIPRLNDFMEATVGERIGTPDRFEAIRLAFVTLGVKRVYWLAERQTELSRQPASLVMECDKPQATALLIRNLLGKQTAIHQKDRTLVVGRTQSDLESLQTVTGVARPEFLNAIDRCNAAHGMVTDAAVWKQFLNDKWLSTIVAEGQIKPQLLKALNAARTVTISFEPAKGSAHLAIETDSSDSAANLVKAWEQLVTSRLTKQQFAQLKLAATQTVAERKFASVQAVTAAVNGIQQLSSTAIRPVLAKALAHGSLKSLSILTLAQQNYHDVYGRFTPQALCDSNGKRLLSWRVILLPFIDNELYKQFHLDEAWDSPHNIKLVPRMPSVFKSSMSAKPARQGKTRFVAPLTAGSLFGQTGQATSIQNVIDGTSNSLMLIETSEERAVVWTKPSDLIVDPARPMQSIINDTVSGFAATTADGMAHWISRNITDETLKALLSIQGQEVIKRKDFAPTK